MTGAIPLAVIAVGGNALITEPGHESLQDQSAAAEVAALHIAAIAEKGWNVVVIHGNGPQVGFILRRSEIAFAEVPTISMDYADANTQGVIGFMFQRALFNEFHRHGVDRRVIAVVTQILVDHADSAFGQPTKPIGSHMDEATAKRCEVEQGWEIREETGRGWRRVVASPQPQRVVDLDAIQTLIADEFIVIACGGEIPVIENSNGTLRSIETVIDKDLTAGFLTRVLSADMLIIATEVDLVALNYGRPDCEWLSSMTLSEAKRFCNEGHFPEGSMGPKIRALISFVETGQGCVLVTNLANLGRAFDGRAGTFMVRDLPLKPGSTPAHDQMLQ